MAPKISVIMPVYNSEKYLNEAIESILRQSYTDFEFLIIDDCSTDNSPSIIQSYRDPRIRYIHNDGNQGVAYSLNRGLALAQGEYIARMDADDISLPEKFKHQVSFLDQHPAVGVLGTAVCLMDASGKKRDKLSFPTEHISLYWRLCFFENPIIHPTVMMRKDVVDRAGGYLVEMTNSEDYDLWCRLSGFTHLANLPDVHLHLRKHSENVSSKKWTDQKQKSIQNSQRLLLKHLKEDISFQQLERAAQAVWLPAQAHAQDFLELIQIKYQLANTFCLSPEISVKEKIMVLRSALKEINSLFARLHGISDRIRVKKWIDKLTLALDMLMRQTDYFMVNQTNKYILLCPHHQNVLVQHGETYICSEGCVYPVIHHIPRFVSENKYAKDTQWKNYQKMQLDSYTGKPLSYDRLKRLAGGDLSIVSGKQVLDAGCGAGRFTEILLQSGAHVLASDLSEVVETNYDNCCVYENYAVMQADLRFLPLAPEQFDVVFCIGVIQHTPSPEETISALARYIKPGGLLVIDHYSLDYPFTPSRKRMRSFLTTKSPAFSLRFCRGMVAVLWSLHRLLWKLRRFPGFSRLRQAFITWSPVVDYHDAYAELGPDLLYAWAMLDTHDCLTDYYKHLRSAEDIRAALTVAGLERIETLYAGNGVEARAYKPLRKD